jgi:hypothetical protein
MASAILSLAALGLAWGCAALRAEERSSHGEPMRYRLTGSGSHWDVVGEDRVAEDLLPRYPEFFELVLDPARTREPNLLRLRDDLEHRPVDRRNFDALNALAIAYFESNYRAVSQRGEGLGSLALSLRSAKLIAVPWRGYSEIDHPALRDAILDFFEDAAFGGKLGAASTAGRLTRIVASLESKEADPARRKRIREIAERLQTRYPETAEAGMDERLNALPSLGSGS